MKKLIVVLLALQFLLFSNVVSYQNSVYAATGTLSPSDLKNGDGIAKVIVLLIAGTIVASGGHAAEMDHEKVREKAQEIYNGLSTTTKETMKSSVDAAITAGKTSYAVSQDFYDELKLASPIVGDWLHDNLLIREHEIVHGSDLVSGYQDDYAYWNKTAQANSIATLSGTSVISIQVSLGDMWGNPAQVEGYNSVTNTWESFFSAPYDSYPELDTYITQARSIDDFNKLLDYLGLPTIVPRVAVSDVPTTNDIVADGWNTTIDRLKAGTKEINIPMDQWLAKTKDGIDLVKNPSDGTFTLPDGSVYDGTISWDIPIPVPLDGAIPTVGNPAIPIENVGVGDIPIESDIPMVSSPPTTKPPSEPAPTGGDLPPFLPLAFLVAIFDFIMAILGYLLRLIKFIVTLPIIPEKPINNEGFQWFRHAKIIGIQIYDVVVYIATFTLGFVIYKIIRWHYQE